MTIDRRVILAGTLMAGAFADSAMAQSRRRQQREPREPGQAAGTPSGTQGLDAAQFGVRPSAQEPQTAALQRAIDAAAKARLPLLFAPGTYRTEDLTLPSGAILRGVPGASKLVAAGVGPMFSARGADHVALEGLGIESTGPGTVLISFADIEAARIAGCEIAAGGRPAISLERVSGEVSGNTISNADSGIFSTDAKGLRITANTLRELANNGILVWRSATGYDGTIVTDNRIENVAAKNGGSGQNGNAINVFRADSVVVQGNRIRACAFSAVRGNAASNLQVLGNNCVDLAEVAIYAEFGFSGAVIANNLVDGAAIGVAVTNFNEGGRLAVVQGNVIRNLRPKRPEGTDPGDSAGIGIGVEADTAVTGNVIEGAPNAGISIGWAQYQRDVTATGNVIRLCPVGISVSVAAGAGHVLIGQNLISGATKPIVGADHHQIVTDDLVSPKAEKRPQISVFGNHVS